MPGVAVALGGEQAGPPVGHAAADQEDVGFLAGFQDAELGVDGGQFGDQPVGVRPGAALGRDRLVPGGPAVAFGQAVGRVQHLDRRQRPAPPNPFGRSRLVVVETPPTAAAEVNSPRCAEGKSCTGGAPQLNGEQGRREYARDRLGHFVPPFAQPSASARTCCRLPHHPRPGQLVFSGQTTTNPSARSPRTQRPDHHAPSARSPRTPRPDTTHPSARSPRTLEHPGFHAHLVLCDAALPGGSAVMRLPDLEPGPVFV